MKFSAEAVLSVGCQSCGLGGKPGETERDPETRKGEKIKHAIRQKRQTAFTHNSEWTYFFKFLDRPINVNVYFLLQKKPKKKT